MFRHLPTLKSRWPNAERNGAMNDVPSTEITGESEQISCHFRGKMTVIFTVTDELSATYDFKPFTSI